MLPAAYLRQKFVRPLLTKDGGITHHRPSAAGDEPSSRHCPVLRFGRGMAQGDGGDALFVRGLWARAIRIRGGTHVGVVCLFWMRRSSLRIS